MVHSHVFTLKQFNCLVAPSSGHFVSYTNIPLFEVEIFSLILKCVPGAPISVKLIFLFIGGLQTMHSGLKIVFFIEKCQFLTIYSQFLSNFYSFIDEFGYKSLPKPQIFFKNSISKYVVDFN